MQQDLVDERGWITREEYLEGLALAQLAPGPLAAQRAIYLGYIRAGVLRATAVGVAFVLPSLLMVLALSVAYVRFGGLALSLAPRCDRSHRGSRRCSRSSFSLRLADDSYLCCKPGRALSLEGFRADSYRVCRHRQFALSPYVKTHMSVASAWFHDPQNGMTINILQREVDQMRFRVDANRVRVRHGKGAFGNQGLPILVKYRHVSGFC